jgi:hypothetical protein
MAARNCHPWRAAGSPATLLQRKARATTHPQKLAHRVL